MNKYLLVFLLLVVSVAGDLYTKVEAEAHLASRTRDYDHFMHVDVPPEAHGQTLGQFLQQRLAWSSDEEATQIANEATYVINEAGEILQPGSAELPLEGGERLEIQDRAITLVPGFLTLRYVQNRGAAWGLLQGKSASFTQPFFIAVGVLAIVVIGFFVRATSSDRRLLLCALGLILGGAVGNIVDRVRYGYVVDFIHWHPGFEWPTFNVADALIVVGVGMLVIEVMRDSLRQRRLARNKAREAQG